MTARVGLVTVVLEGARAAIAGDAVARAAIQAVSEAASQVVAAAAWGGGAIAPPARRTRVPLCPRIISCVRNQPERQRFPPPRT